MSRTVNCVWRCVGATGSADVYGHVDRFPPVPYYPPRADLCHVYYGGTVRNRSKPVGTGRPKMVALQGIELGAMEVSV